jgi:hypothetical protein
VEEGMAQKADRLAVALIGAFPGYLTGRLDSIGVAVDAGLDEAIVTATSRLERDLTDLLSRPASAQAESPLELVRRATEPVTEALSARDVPAVERDDWDRANNPGDRYGLYPASSQDLGDGVWRLHLDWGVHKAGAVAGVVPREAPKSDASVPTVALFGVPVQERARLQDAIESHGFNTQLWRNPAALEDAPVTRPVLALVHLDHPAAHDAIRKLAGSGIRVVATGEGINDLTTPGLIALGAEEAMALDRLLARLDRLLHDLT